MKPGLQLGCARHRGASPLTLTLTRCGSCGVDDGIIGLRLDLTEPMHDQVV
jgi:hypothetical protein